LTREVINVKIKLKKLHRENGFAKISKNLARYRSENNFIRASK